MVWKTHFRYVHTRIYMHTHTQVRLPLLQPSFLCDCVGRERVVEGSPRAMRLVMEAMEYHLLPERRANIKSLRTQPRNASSKVQVGKKKTKNSGSLVLRLSSFTLSFALKWKSVVKQERRGIIPSLSHFSPLFCFCVLLEHDVAWK